MKRLILILLMVVPAGGAVCAQDDGFPRTVTDLTGRAISIPARPDVIAVIGENPALAQIVSPDRLRFLDPAAVPDWSGVGLLILPDLYATAYPALLESAAASGVPVFQTIPITGVQAWRDMVTRIGQATGEEARAAAAIARLDRRLAAVGMATADVPPARVLVLTPEGYTFGQGTLITELIGAAGGINVAAEAGFADYRQLDDSLIRDLAPDVILLAPAWDNAAAFAANPAYAGVPAVRAGRVIRLPFSPTTPPDPGAAAVLLGLMLHPQAFLPAW